MPSICSCVYHLWYRQNRSIPQCTVMLGDTNVLCKVRQRAFLGVDSARRPRTEKAVAKENNFTLSCDASLLWIIGVSKVFTQCSFFWEGDFISITRGGGGDVVTRAAALGAGFWGEHCKNNCCCSSWLDALQPGMAASIALSVAAAWGTEMPCYTSTLVE